MENFTQVASTTTLRDARQQFLDNDITNRSNSAGAAFPTTNLYVGMFCFRTDDGGLYELKSISPVTWVKLFDLDTGRASDSELLDGQDGSFFRNASNLNAGTVPSARLSGSYAINAASATVLQTARLINGTSFNGSANINTTEWVHSQRDFVDGTLITTDINYGVTNGDPWILRIEGNSYGGRVPVDIQVQGYIHSDTIINTGGYSNGFNVIGMVALNVGGNLVFWFPRQQFWQGFNVRVYNASPGRAVNRVVSITNSVKPAGTKEVDLSAVTRLSLRSDNFNEYAPTLTGLGASGTWGINVTGNAATATKWATGRTISLTGAATAASAAFDGSANLSISVTGLNASNLNAGTVPAARLSGSYSINAATATTLQTARTIALSGAATGTATSFNGGANISIPVTGLNASNLNTGTVPDARLTGVYSGITLQTNGGNTHFTTPNSGSQSVNDRSVFGLAQYKSDSASATGAIVFYAPNTNTSIMHRMVIEGMLYQNGPTVKAIVQGYRTTGAWSNTSLVNLGIHDLQVRWGVDAAGKNCLILGDVGTVWSYPMMCIAYAQFSHTGASDAYCKDWSVGLVTDLSTFTNVTPNISRSDISTGVSTAATLKTARSIALTGAATGTATSFDGSNNISIPVTALNASNLNSGTVPSARLTGTYAISVTGNAGTATKWATARSLTLSTGASGSATFDGSANATLSVTGLNASSLNSGTVPDARLSGAYTGFTNITGSGTIDFARFLGSTVDSAASPSFSFTQDPNTGIWSPGADQLGVSVGGVNRATFSTTVFSLATPQNLTGNNYCDYGANSTWAATLRVGGNGYATASKADLFASVVTTNGNIHIDSGTTRATYLNFYSGSGGTIFGNGANAIAASMDSAGQLWQGTTAGAGNKYWHAGNDGSGSGLDADLLDGLQLQANRSAAVGANQIVASQANGYVYLNYINTNTPVNENPTIGQVFVSNNSDNAFVRKASVAHLTSSLSGTAPINITGSAGNSNSISSAVNKSYTWTATQNFASNGSGVGVASQSGHLGAYSTGGAPATMHFHRAGLYAINMGLDTDNVFRLGGWSDGANNFRFTVDSVGNFTARGTLTESSDRRLKKKLKKHKVRDFLTLQPYEYVKKAKGSTPEIGFMAQDVAEHYPEFVQTDSNGYLSVSYARFVVPMIAKMAEQEKRIENLEEKVAQLEKLIARMGK